MADISAIKLPDGNTYDVKDTTKQPLLVSGTNIKTINNQSLLGSGNLTITASGTSVPTADAVAEFDSTAHMNSTDMTSTEIDNFVNSLDVTPSNLLDFFYPVGSCYTTSTHSNPSSHLGGTWTLIDKRFAPTYLNNTGFTYNTSNTTDGASVASLSDHSIEFRFIWKNKVALSDSTVTIGTFNTSQLGFSQSHGVYTLGMVDGLNAVGLFQLTLGDTSKELRVIDWITRATSYPTGTGETVAVSCVIKLTFSQMMDSFCNQFIWERTA